MIDRFPLYKQTYPQYAIFSSLTQPRIRIVPYYKTEIISNMMKGVHFLVTLALLALATSLASAYDPSPLQDFCVAINNTDSAGMYMLLVEIITLFWNHYIFYIDFSFLFWNHYIYMTCYYPLIVTEVCYL
jgi:hypothetical protein